MEIHNALFFVETVDKHNTLHKANHNSLVQEHVANLGLKLR
jgi:hypothetical protein